MKFQIAISMICFIGFSRGQIFKPVPDPKFSLIPPFLNSSMPNWIFNDTATLHPDHIQLTSQDFSKIGSIWNQNPVQSSSWELFLNYTLLKSRNTGTDKLVLWYSSQYDIDAPYIIDYHLGHKELGNFDGYYIALTRKQRAVIDIEIYDKFSNKSLSCMVPENLAESAHSILAIQYFDGTLIVNHTGKGDEMEFCTSVNNFNIRLGYYFGITASSRITEPTFNLNWLRFTKYDLHANLMEMETKNNRNYYHVVATVILVVIVAVLISIAIYIYKDCSNRVREVSGNNDDKDRRSSNIYETILENQEWERTPSGNYHMYQKPDILLNHDKSKDEYDHLNFSK
uniref:CSON012827 protein n=1 Tax=Culicoides sonorensis TaxID=179676 RepID=A0A336M6I7_CULSO